MRFSPGEYLQDELRVRHWAVAAFAATTGIAPDTLIRLLAGEEPLTDDIAARIGRALGTSATLWRNLERAYRATEGE